MVKHWLEQTFKESHQVMPTRELYIFFCPTKSVCVLIQPNVCRFGKTCVFSCAECETTTIIGEETPPEPLEQNPKRKWTIFTWQARRLSCAGFSPRREPHCPCSCTSAGVLPASPSALLLHTDSPESKSCVWEMHRAKTIFWHFLTDFLHWT